ncbi:MAG: hypothetical protein ACN4GT_08085 [Gammaproteobacteria bacterium]
MAIDGDKYITLMASMPALPAPFAARELPLSRIGLAGRLRLLDADDGQLLDRILHVMVWERIDITLPAAEIIREVDEVMNRLHSETLRTVVRERFELRTVLAALRRRRRGETAPPAGTPWGYGRFVDQISRNWSRPHFGLRRTLPWLGEIRDLHDVGSTRRLDLAIARVAWHGLVNAQQAHEFDFDAVALYVLKYDMIARRLADSAAKARERFDELVASGLGNFTTLVTEPA